MKKLFLVLLMVGCVALVPSFTRVAATGTTTIRLATLAPPGSSWDKVFRAWSNTLKEQTGGAVQFQFFAGGIAGDERDVIRKMKLGQMDSASLTSIGLSQIVRSVSILQVPGAFENYEQLGRVREGLGPEFEAMFAKEGYQFVAWGDAGFGRVFSKKPILMPEDYKSVRPWIPREDATAPDLMKLMGANGVPLGIPEVFPALQTGMVDTVVASAIAAVALQWFRYVTHVSKDTSTAIVGGAIIRQEIFNTLAPDHQKIVLETGKKAHTALIAQVMKEDQVALKTLLGRGMIEFDPLGSDAQKKAWKAINDQLFERLTGKLWSKDLADRVKACASGGKCQVQVAKK